MSDPTIDLLLTLPADPVTAELLTARLNDTGFSGFLEDDKGLHCYISASLWSDRLLRDVESLVSVDPLGLSRIIGITEIPDQNWNERWEASIQPVNVTERMIITPSWHTIRESDGRIVLVIDPKMSFGTGYHESTRLVLRMLERSIVPGTTVLDVGTGTGILAIAAVKLGAASAIGIDIDEWSYTNGRENVDRNGLSGYIEIRIGSLDVVPESSFGIILANITRNAIVGLLPSLLKKLGNGGTLLLSGLLASEEETIHTALLRHACRIKSTVRENEWIGVQAEKV